jgi:carboxylesterase
MNANVPRIMPGAQPFFARGSAAVGVLCLHGFTASPAEVRWLAQHLAQDGHTVFAPRLAGHGSAYHDLARARWRDWVLSAWDGYQVLAAQCQRVVIAGHSMGGMIAVLLAAALAQQPEAPLAGLVLLATPLSFPAATRRRSRWLRRVMPYTDQTDRSSLPQYIRGVQRTLGESPIGRVRYDRWATSAVHELMLLASEADRALPELRGPALLIYAASDDLATPAEGERIRARAATSQARLRILGKGGHIVTQDEDREQAFAWTSAFVRQVTGQSEGERPTS